MREESKSKGWREMMWSVWVRGIEEERSPPSGVSRYISRPLSGTRQKGRRVERNEEQTGEEK